MRKMLQWAYLPECNAPPPGWSVRPFRDVAEVVAGQSPPSETYNRNGEGLPFLQGNADFGRHFPSAREWCSAPAKKAQAGDTLISVGAPVGEINRADQAYAIGRGLAAIRARNFDADLLYQAMQRWRWSLQRVAQGTTFDAVTARHFAQLFVAVPDDPKEQAAIARILDAVDTTIERTRGAIDRAQEFRRSLLQRLLSVGLDRKGFARDRSHHEFARYRHGRFPQAWRPSSIGAEFDLQTGFTLNESRRPRYRVRRYLRVANVQRDHLSLHDVAELEARDAEFELRRLELGDLLVVEGHADRMQIGRCAAVSPEAVGLTFQNHLFRLRTRGEVISEFAVLWLNSEFAQRYWNARCATSSGLNTINQRMLHRMFFPVPDEREQSRIIDVVQSQRTHLEALTGKQRALNDLKRSLMHDLLTGKVRADQLKLEEAAA